MRIIGKKSDFYDFVGHAQGYDSDPHATIYNRSELPQQITVPKMLIDELKSVDVFAPSCIIVGEYEFVFVQIRQCPNDVPNPQFDLDEFIMVSEGNRDDIVELYRQLLNRRDDIKPNQHSWQHANLIKSVNAVIAVAGTRNTSEQHKQLLQSVKVPVFQVIEQRRGRYVISEIVPKLTDFGINSVLSPEQCYQAIDHAITNIIKQNPDTTPVNVVPDKSKVVNHGFDARVSFRHRK